jgi:hypothetical protein
MFDSHFHGDTRTHIDVHTNITEKRAPTDEAVRLLKEMEAAAAAKVQAAIRVQDTAFECVVHVTDDFLNGEKKIAAIFSMNGKKLRADCATNESDTVEGAILKLIAAVSERVAIEIVSPCLTRTMIHTLK